MTPSTRIERVALIALLLSVLPIAFCIAAASLLLALPELFFNPLRIGVSGGPPLFKPAANTLVALVGLTFLVATPIAITLAIDSLGRGSSEDGTQRSMIFARLAIIISSVFAGAAVLLLLPWGLVLIPILLGVPTLYKLFRRAHGGTTPPRQQAPPNNSLEPTRTAARKCNMKGDFELGESLKQGGSARGRWAGTSHHGNISDNIVY